MGDIVGVDTHMKKHNISGNDSVSDTSAERCGDSLSDSSWPYESTVRRLAGLWGISASAQRNQSLALVETIYPYNAFADESQQARFGRSVFGVAAYVAAFDRWIELEQRWREILHHFKVPLDGHPEHTEPFFHMTDFIARKEQFKNDWSDSKRDSFIELLTGIASDHTVTGVACCIDIDEYRRVLPDDVQDKFREPYFFCVWGVLSALSGLEDRFPIVLPNKPLWFLFDRKKKATKLASEIFYTVKELRANHVLGEMGFGAMWNTPQLQAADLLTYEAIRRSLEERDDPERPRRKSLQRLDRKGNLHFIHLNEDRLKRYIELVREADLSDANDKD
jgi:hypothetical protein